MYSSFTGKVFIHWVRGELQQNCISGPAMLSRLVPALRPRLTRKFAGGCVAFTGGTALCGVAFCDAPAVSATNDEEFDTTLDEHLDGRAAVYLARARYRNGLGSFFLTARLLPRAIFVAGVKQNIRYVAYSSDAGESFRPILPSWAVNAC